MFLELSVAAGVDALCSAHLVVSILLVKAKSPCKPRVPGPPLAPPHPQSTHLTLASSTTRQSYSSVPLHRLFLLPGMLFFQMFTPLAALPLLKMSPDPMIYDSHSLPLLLLHPDHGIVRTFLFLFIVVGCLPSLEVKDLRALSMVSQLPEWCLTHGRCSKDV